MIQVADVRPELLVPDEPGGHVWVMVAAFKLTDAEIHRHTANGSEIDIDTARMAWAQVHCMACECEWSRESSAQACLPVPMP